MRYTRSFNKGLKIILPLQIIGETAILRLNYWHIVQLYSTCEGKL